MSSMRNAVQRRNHKERAQPLEREKWGVLEKHKDYSLRAKDFNEKKKRLKLLRQKAAERNPDEFNYGMLSSKSNKGRKLAERGNTVLSHDAVKLLKTQDAGYLQAMIQKTKRARERLEQEFLLGEEGEVEVLGRGKHGKNVDHVIFVDNKEEQESCISRRDTHAGLRQKGMLGAVYQESENGDSLDLEESTPNSRGALQKKEEAKQRNQRLRRSLRKQQNARKSQLAALKTREKDLMDAELELELQRAKISNTVGGVNKDGVKWKVRERRK